MLAGRRIVLGVAGGIAAYKSAEIARGLIQAGCDVTAVMTRNARRFLAPLTLRTITGRPVAVRFFSDPQSPLPHIALARWADLMLIAPATADLIARAAQGRADDLLAALILDATSPVLWAPAMNCRMWENPLTQDNVRRLIAAGHTFLEPAEGELACGEEGKGRLPSVDAILKAVGERLAAAGPLAGVRVLITAGPTRETWDAVRFLSNRSSGRMGYALAAEAQRRGAAVTLISGPVNLEVPRGIRVVPVTTAREMHERAVADFPAADIVIAAAAVADFRPAEPHAGKIKKTEMPESLKLVRNPDILADLGRAKSRQVLVGFAAESGPDPAARGLAKLRAKNLDLIVVNAAGGEDDAFAAESAAVTLVTPRGDAESVSRRPKPELAAVLWDRINDLWAQRTKPKV